MKTTNSSVTKTPKPKKKKSIVPLTSGQDWTFSMIEDVYAHIDRIAKEKFKLDTYQNQIEIITSEQMLDAYAAVGLPVYYNHWSFGKLFVKEQEMYNRGYMGLAYEIVINSSPCISYLMEENTMMMQTLVIAHAAFGHNAFFKNNYLFRQWTDAEGILDYLVFAKKYIADCEEKYGIDEVEAVIDACHALRHYGVDKYQRPPKLSSEKEKAREKERNDYIQSQLNDLWRTVPANTSTAVRLSDPTQFPKEPQENILYFLEKNAPNLESWKREIIRIIRKLSQYFYPQMQTKLMNEGFACVSGDTLVDTPNGLIRADDIVESKYNGLVTGKEQSNRVVQWYEKQDKHRIKIVLKNGLTLHGGADHQILLNNNWVRLDQLTVGQSIPIIRGKNEWPTKEVDLPILQSPTRKTLIEKCDEDGIHIKTYYKWLNNSSAVSDNKARQCKDVYDYISSTFHTPTNRIAETRSSVNIPKTLDEGFAYWLGLITGDGGLHYGKHSKIYFISGDPELREWFVNYSQNILGVGVSIRSDRNHWVATIHNHNLFEYLTTVLEVEYGKTSDIKQVPKYLYCSPKKVVSAFIRGHMDTDGGVCKQSGSVVLVSKSYNLISVEQQLLLKMGIVSSVSFQHSDGCYRLIISGSDSLMFSENIKFNLPRKQNLLEQYHMNKKWYLEKNDESKIVSITHDIGPVYDFGVEKTHEYKASGFINHNCFVHYNMMYSLYEEGLVDDGFMLEFLESHTGVVAQRDYDSRGYNGINPYALGFAMFQDIKRICMEPTEEDREWFPDWAGNGNWQDTILFAMKNFKDDSFILQYLSPKIIRDFKLFVVMDDNKDPKLEISAIHDKAGYMKVREALSRQYNIGHMLPDIQVYNVDRWGDRSLALRHYMTSERPLEYKTATKVLEHLTSLWGYDVTLTSVDQQGNTRAAFTLTEDKKLLDIFVDQA
jgi:spore cortex formation protein SpoVR/YcgB (stage V sporulation)